MAGTEDVALDLPPLALVLLIAGLRIAEKRQAKQKGKQLASGVSPAAAFGFEPEDLAIVCASHGGMRQHTG